MLTFETTVMPKETESVCINNNITGRKSMHHQTALRKLCLDYLVFSDRKKAHQKKKIILSVCHI